MCELKSTTNFTTDDSLDALNEVELVNLLDQPTAQAQTDAGTGHRLRNDEQHAGFDDSAGDTWIYPKNMPVRAYQYSISQAALYRNTLVVLPTGLGKTFIAAVVMYNLYRWYPTGKVIFMAPTRPLVAQQIEACQKIMPFPPADTVELTGRLAKQKRAELWQSKRVFFATPQVVHSDMVAVDAPVSFPFEQVKLLVFDEAHKARGRYAYTEVAHSIVARNRNFRVLALSATPGRTMEDIAGVCRQLYISHLEVRWDTSIDVMPYVHHRSMKTIEVPLSSELRDLRKRLLDIIDPYVRQLIDADVLRDGVLANFNRNYLLFEQKRFRDRNQRERHPQYGMISSNFSFCISLYHALELLERQGLRVFVSNFEQDETGNSKFVLTLDQRLRDMVDEVKQRLGPNPFDCSAQGAQVPAQVLDFGHPKFEQARQCVVKHFEAHPDSRAIVFCEYRESVLLIYRLLQKHGPLLKPRCFVGQGGGTTGTLRALTQKQQLQTMNDFRSGKNNILVATCIGEEGIDVGEVELIVCFDISSSNPQRFVQRIGRTGRKKNGNVVMLVTEGREAQLLREVLAHKDDINRKLLRSSVIKDAFYKEAPRLVPLEFEPKCLQTLIEPVQQKPQPAAAAAEAPSKKAKPATRKKVNKSPEKVKGSKDLRDFFKQTPPLALTADEQNVFEASPAAPSTQLRVQLHKSVGVLGNFLLPQIKTQQQAQQTPPSTPPATRPAQPRAVNAQQLRKLNKMLLTTKPLLNETQRSEDLLTQLGSRSLPRSIKVRMLQASLGYVREVCDKMQVLQALLVASDEMSREEQRIRDDYELICAQFADGAQALTAFLEEQTALQTGDKDNDLLALAARAREADLAAATERVFADLPAPDYCVDNFAYEAKAWQEIEERRKERTRYEQSLCLPGESMVYNGCQTLTGIENMSEEQLAAFGESKYQSQLWDGTNDDSLRRSKHVSAGGGDVSSKQSSRPTDENDGSSTLSDQELLTTLQMIEPMSKCCSTPAAKPLRTSNVSASTPLAGSKNKNKTVTLVAPAPKLNDAALGATDANAKHHPIEELELNMDDFLEPFPEERFLTLTNPTATTEQIPRDDDLLGASLMPSPSPTSSERKENRNANQTLQPNTAKYFTNNNHNNNVKVVMRHSPDLFNDTVSPVKPIAMKSSSLAAKLAAKCKPPPHSVAMETPVSPAQMLKSPQSRAKTDSTKYEKSPSVFDIYLQNMGGRAKFQAPPQRGDVAQRDVSPLVRRRASAKRKIIDSDSDAEEQQAAKVQRQKSPAASSNSDSDFESVPATQMPRASSFHVQRQKRRIRNSFIDCEAADSGSNASEAEAEHTIGTYLKDSVIVSSDGSSEEDEAARSRVQAMYLQAVRSPHARPGAFKIPGERVYNDAEDIFSQTLPPASQYVPDSFVVSGDEDAERAEHTQDVSLCPLERAERILKQERRNRRRQQRSGLAVPAKRRRVRCMTNSSSSDDDNDVIFVK